MLQGGTRREYQPNFASNPQYFGHQWLSPPVNWEARKAEFVKALDDEKRERLARELGVSTSSLKGLGVGWNEAEKCYTFPELDHAGQCVGIMRRFTDGRKRAMPGGKRGIILPANWLAWDNEEPPGPILIPEGASDVAAALTMNLKAIGRPSATGGLEHLTPFLSRQPSQQEVYVVGERDEKPDGKWPGKEAAEKMAQGIADQLGRKVGWTLPPKEFKDLREYLQGRDKNTTPAIRGKNFLDVIQDGLAYCQP